MPAERIGGARAPSTRPRGSSLYVKLVSVNNRSLLAPIGLFRPWAGPVTREVFRVLPEPYHMVEPRIGALLLNVVSAFEVVLEAVIEVPT